MRICSLSVQNHALSYWVITKTEFGARAIDTCQCFAVTPFNFWSVSLLKNVALFNKATVKMHFAKVFSLLTRSLLFDLHLGIRKQTQTKIGSFFGLSTVFGTVPVIGKTKSMRYFAPLVYPLRLKIFVSTQDLSKILRIHPVPSHPVHSPLVSTLMISFTSPKTLLSRCSSVVFWPNVAKSILWASTNGSSESTSPGVLLPLWSRSISISLVLPPIWLRASFGNRKTLPLKLRRIVPASLSTQLLLRRATTIPQHNSVGKRLTRV
jgi:hypothetical protein